MVPPPFPTVSSEEPIEQNITANKQQNMLTMKSRRISGRTKKKIRISPRFKITTCWKTMKKTVISNIIWLGGRLELCITMGGLRERCFIIIPRWIN